MANTKSALKAARKSARNAVRNQSTKTRLKTLAKAVKAVGTDAEKARAAAIAFSSALDKAVKSGVIHANTASRHKAQVAKLIYTKK